MPVCRRDVDTQRREPVARASHSVWRGGTDADVRFKLIIFSHAPIDLWFNEVVAGIDDS